MAKNAGPIRVGLVGLGRAGWNMHLPELANKTKMFEVVAVCDVIEERTWAGRDQLHAAAYLKIEDLLKDKNVELVDIATRSSDHFEHAMMALKTGKHVQIEKPMTCTHEQAKKLAAAVKKSKGKFFVRHNRRFEPTFVHVQEIIKSGLLGEVYEIKLRRHSYQRRADWQTIKKCGGGQLLNWGPHIIDHSLQLLGSPVKSMWSNLQNIAAAGDAEDTLKIIFEGKNGRIVDMEISGAAAISDPEYMIHGSKGSLRATGEKIEMRYLEPDRRLAKVKADAGTPAYGGFGNDETLPWMTMDMNALPKGPNGMDHIWDEIYESIRNRKKFPVTLEDAVRVMEVISKVKKGTEF